MAGRLPGAGRALAGPATPCPNTRPSSCWLGIAWTAVDLNRPAVKVLVAAAALAEVLGLTVVLDLYGVYFSPFPASRL